MLLMIDSEHRGLNVSEHNCEKFVEKVRTRLNQTLTALHAPPLTVHGSAP